MLLILIFKEKNMLLRNDEFAKHRFVRLRQSVDINAIW